MNKFEKSLNICLDLKKVKEISLSRPLKYETKLKQNRGKGYGKNYRPWYEVGENIPMIPGTKRRGNGHRIKGLKTDRVHHLLSNGERFLFVLFDLKPEITDIREQYPILEIEIAKNISNDLGIKYPSYTQNHILTSDFLLDFKNGKQQIVTFKPIANINKRQLELFQIERAYWESKGIEWNLITDREIPKNEIFIKNQLDIYHAAVQYNEKDLLFEEVKGFYYFILEYHKKHKSLGIIDFCDLADSQNQFESGVSLRVLKLLIAKRILGFNIMNLEFSNAYLISSINTIKNVTDINQSDLAA
ncbi:MAG: TnsA endonuclease N-terminal domain-containing protein [Candidatus Cyclobacteriaceae bacterium M2_1C_046]